MVYSALSSSALQLVDSVPFHSRELELPESGVGEAHSLHYALPLRESLSPEIANYLIERYSRKGEIVLDPFCGSGTVALESALRGRVPYSSDTNLFFVKMTQAKLDPADLTEVTLGLQGLNVRRPINSGAFSDYFSAYFDIETFRELVHLRDYVHSHADRAARFVELVGASILHGPSAGYLSVYTFPQISLSPEMQRDLNKKRHQIPDYRAVVPRLLRRTASILRDGIPSIIKSSSQGARITRADARNLNYIVRPGVSLILTAPPLPGEGDSVKDLWLRMWFSGISAREQTVDSVVQGSAASLDGWLEFMNEVLFEGARVTCRGARAAMLLRSTKIGSQQVELDEALRQLVDANLSNFWEPECVLIQRERSARLKDCLEERDQRKIGQRNRILILRRR